MFKRFVDQYIKIAIQKRSFGFGTFFKNGNVNIKIRGSLWIHILNALCLLSVYTEDF